MDPGIFAVGIGAAIVCGFALNDLRWRRKLRRSMRIMDQWPEVEKELDDWKMRRIDELQRAMRDLLWNMTEGRGWNRLQVATARTILESVLDLEVDDVFCWAEGGPGVRCEKRRGHLGQHFGKDRAGISHGWEEA